MRAATPRLKIICRRKSSWRLTEEQLDLEGLTAMCPQLERLEVSHEKVDFMSLADNLHRLPNLIHLEIWGVPSVSSNYSIILNLC